MKNFAELHCHTDIGSNTRMLDSTVKVDRLIDKAIEYRLSGVAITDHESLSAHIKAIKYYQSIRQSNPDFKLILGNEIYLIDSNDYQNTNNFYHFILLAIDEIGHEQLRRLSTRAWERVYTYKRMRRVPTFYSDIEEIVGNNKGHLIAMTACLGGELANHIKNKNYTRAFEFISWCRKQFGNKNFFIEMQTGVTEEQTSFNKKMADWSKEYGFNLVVTNDVHYLTAKDRKIHEAFLNSKDEERETGDFYESTYLKTPDEMLERLNYLDEEVVQKAFCNTVSIAQRVQDYDLHQNVIIPQKKLPVFQVKHHFKQAYDKCKYIKKFAYSDYEQDKYLLYQIESGFIAKGEPFEETQLNRIDIELKQLWDISQKLNQRMSAYYNMGKTLIDIMWADDLGNSLVGVARGSVTGYYICYLIDITQVNPIQWNLPYWRHLVADRPELPDVDIDSQSSQRPIIFQKMREIFGDDRCLNIITFKRETSKAAILTSARGLDIPIEVARELAAIVPVERGKTRTIKQCIYGDKENGCEPIKEFITLVNQYDMWLDTILAIENLVSGISSHASGFYIFNNPYVKQNSLMITPAGIKCTCWDMEDSDYCGALKFDFLTIEALDKIRKTMDLLIQDGKMQWKGSLRDTYNAYLYPNVISYDDKNMWDILGQNKLFDIFQFDTLVGTEAIKKIKPTSVKQLALASSVMRLMGDENSISPIDKFVLFKNKPDEWYKEMREYGLSDSEIKVIERHLKQNHGCSIEQEDVMELVMDKDVANFNIVEANKLRKGIAKKKADIIDSIKELYFKKGREQGTSQAMLKYVWDCDITPQLGYSFSRNHTLPYSIIGLQEMNLATLFLTVYWNTACLTINAAADSNVEKNNSTNYGKIATAIGNMQANGVNILLPDINQAQYEFAPNEAEDAIMFGLKGINGIGDDVARSIVSHRPYKSFADFLERVDIPNKTMINLIKAGAFDKLEVDKSRQQLMKKYIVSLARSKNDKKQSLDLKNLPSLIDLNLIPSRYASVVHLYKFRKFCFDKSNAIKEQINDKKNWYAIKDVVAIGFFEDNCARELKENQDYCYTNYGIAIRKNDFDKFYNNKIAELKKWITMPETLRLFNATQLSNFANNEWEKNCLGNCSKWEMDSLCFYSGMHELGKVDMERYRISEFNDIPEQPVPISESTSKQKSKYETYKLYSIIGTVLDKNKDKHYITILTPSGVVKCKFYKGAFNYYDKQVADFVSGKKTIVEKSWFTRGNKLLLTGIRRGDMFYPKRYSNSIEQHTVKLITNIHNYGETLEFKLEREVGSNG